MKYRLIFLAIFFVLYSFIAAAQGSDDAKSAAWLKKITANAVKGNAKGKYQQAPEGYALYFSQAGEISVPYLVYVPKGYNPAKPTSVVVFLHGAILARETFQYKDPTIAEEPIFSIADTLNTLVVFPFARADFAWGRQEAANENIITIVKRVEETYHVDKKRVYIGGISMGGNAAFWFVSNKANLFAGFYTFSALPGAGNGNLQLSNVTPGKPLYSMNAKDDRTFPYSEVAAIYEAHKKEIPGWHFSTVENGGHRFIYGSNGKYYVKQLLGNLLAPAGQ